MAKPEKAYKSSAVTKSTDSSPGGHSPTFEATVIRNGFDGGTVLTVTGKEKTVVALGVDSIVAALNKASGS